MSLPVSNLAVVTGASRGIGAAIARELSEKGYGLLLVARGQEGLEQVAGYLQAEGTVAHAISADLSIEKDVKKISAYIETLGLKLAVLVHNAGIAKVAPIAETTTADWRRVIDVNLTGPFLLTRELLPKMDSGGQIIFVNSVGGKQSFSDWGAYCASKHGLRSFADTLRQEVSGRGIRVTSIFPAAVDTPLHDDLPLDWDRKKMMRPNDIARAVAYVTAQPAHIRINELELESSSGRF